MRTKANWTSVPRSYWELLCWDDADVVAPNKIKKLVETCYAKIGGWPGDFKSLVAETDVWLVLDPRDPRAAMFGRTTPHGIKWICLAADDRSKRDLLDLLVDLGNTRGNYAELSGSLARYVLRRCPRVVEPRLIERILRKTVVHEGLDGWYTRMLTGGMVKQKIIVGRPVLA